MTARFDQLPVGARFEFRGRRYHKIGLTIAGGEDRIGHVFLDQTEVLPDDPAQILPLDPVRANRPHWTSYLTPAPPPREVDG